MTQQAYGRIENGKIVEYPVYENHIKRRGHPMDWYVPVVALEVPTYDARIQSIQETLTITGKYIVASYSVVSLSVDAILDKLYYPNGRFNPTNPAEQVEPATVTIASVDPVVLNHVVEQVSSAVGKDLDAFVATRNYDDMRSCATYLNSSIATFAAEAATAVGLRDTTYTNLYTYLAEVQAGTKPVPQNLAEIKANLPVLAWS
jgi:hypothetical protein